MRWMAGVLTLLAVGSLPAETPPLVVTGEAAEVFLKTAQIIAVEDFPNKGITHPKRVTLVKGDVTSRAVFKSVDEFSVKTKLTSGATVFGLRDSYRNEIAAYELAKLLGLDFIPPTVERTIGGEVGSLNLWIYGTMTEWDRLKEKKLRPPDVVSWNNQMSSIRLFMHLTWDTDYNNISNLLIDENWKIWKIDSSRAFLPNKKLRREASLVRFSRSFVAALKGLTREQVDDRLGPLLTKGQIEGLWARRAAILEIVQRRIAAHGDASVLYD